MITEVKQDSQPLIGWNEDTYETPVEVGLGDTPTDLAVEQSLWQKLHQSSQRQNVIFWR